MRMYGKLRSSLRRLVMTIIYLCLAASVLSACAADSAFQSADKVKVTATIGMISDLARNIGGEHVEVIGLMKSGVDPHTYKASQGDLRKLEEADIVFYNGLHLEGTMIDVLEKLNEKKPSIAITRHLDTSELLQGDPQEGTEYDPHIWFDVEKWMSAAEVVRDELSKLDPARAEQYRSNADNYLGQLRELHEYVKAEMASIPEQSRVLVTAHDAFGYFGEAYGVKVMGLQGISTASEAGIKDVADLRDYLVEHRIKAVFVESSVPRDNIQAMIDGAKQKGHEVTIGGELFSDAMGEEGTPEGTYIGMVRHNVQTIVKALK